MIEVIKKIIDRNLSIVTAESITGGLISKTITDVPNSSKVLKESFIVYSNEAKINILGVEEELIDKYGVVSSEVAKSMVLHLKEKTNRDICISTTGNAGPTVCDDKPVGKVFIGIIFKNDCSIIECDFSGDREKIRNDTLNKVFKELDKLL